MHAHGHGTGVLVKEEWDGFVLIREATQIADVDAELYIFAMKTSINGRLNYTLGLMIMMVTISCQHHDQQQNMTVLSPKKTSTTYHLCDLIDDVVIIPLEQAEGTSFLKEIYAADQYKDEIFIKSFGQPGLFVYNESGSFLRKYSSFSNENGTFNDVSAFSIDHKNGHLYISDKSRKVLLKYDLEKETLIQVKKVDIMIQSIYFFDNHLFTLGYDPTNGFLKVYNSSLNLVNEYISKPDYYNTVPARRPFAVYKGQVLVNASFSDTLYRISPNTEPDPIATLGASHQSLSSLCFDELEELIITRQDWIFSDENTYVIPYGLLTATDELIMIPTLNWQQLVWHPGAKKVTTFSHKNITGLELMGSKFFQSILPVNNGWLYGPGRINYNIELECDLFDRESCSTLQTACIKLNNLSSEGFENPYIVKYKLRDSFKGLL